jgi:hypothetical protein
MAHSFGFAVFLMLVYGRRRRGVIQLAAAWALVETALEAAQIGTPLSVANLIRPFASGRLLETLPLLSTGVFDIQDLAAIWIGAISAMFAVSPPKPLMAWIRNRLPPASRD